MEEHGNGWRLILGDCLEVMPTLGKVDAVVTDPPYGVGYSSGMEGAYNGAVIIGDASTEARDAALSIIRCPALVFGSWKMSTPRGAHTALVWDKGLAAGMGDLSVPWKPNFEMIFVVGKGFFGSRDDGVLKGHTIVSWASAGRTHPTEKPVSLMVALLSKCPPEWTILDPFAGSGTTGVACLRLGRRFVGIEKDPAYFRLACDRLRAEENGSTLQATRAGQVPMFGGGK